MRARSLKPGYFKNEILGSADPLYGVLFQGLWCMADREGRLQDIPLRICAEVFPYRRKLTERRVDDMLWWLHSEIFIVRYRTETGLFIQVLEFKTHQHPHQNEAPSKIQPLIPGSHRSPPAKGKKPDVPNTRALGLTPSSLTPDSGLLTPDSPLTDSSTSGQGQANGHSAGAPSETQNGNSESIPGECAGGEGDRASDGSDAWKDVGCDEGAYEAWLRYRAQAGHPVPPATRVVNAKLLAGKGSAEEQRAFVDQLIHLEFKRFHDPAHPTGAASRKAKSADELEAEALARGEKLWQ